MMQPHVGDRPPSRNGSTPAFAGVGARGRSPSPQPFNAQQGMPQNGYAPPPQQQQPYGAPPAQAYAQPQQRGQSPGPGMAFSPAPGTHGAYPSAASGYGAPPQQAYPPAGYGPPQPQAYAGSPAPHGQQYQASPFPNAYAASPAQAPAGYAQQHPQQQPSGYGQPQRQASLGASQSLGGYGAPPLGGPAGYAGSPAPIVQQQPPQPQRAPSAAGAIPPTGQYTDEGKPIIFYVNAIYDYQASGAEEFSFSQGDVIAVTSTDPDGWWQGNKVGVTGGGHLFPSNFTELLP